MRIAIFVYGSWGDLRPHVVLGAALKASGHQVQVIAPPAYEEWVRARNLDFYPQAVDMGKLIAELSGRDVFNPLEQIRIVRKELPPIFSRMALDMLEATREADVLITIEFALAILLGVIEQNNLRTLLVNPAPLNPTREFSSTTAPPPGWFPFPGWYNQFSYAVLERMSWSMVGPSRKALHQRQPDLPKKSFGDFRAALTAIPALTIVSPSVIKRPADWGENRQITGYLFDDDDEWTPPQALTSFLGAGEAPVYVGFGSMPDSKPAATTRTILDAVQQAGKRAVILTGWAGLGAGDVPGHVYVLKYAPHSWLFPRMAAIVHHGGAGTTASGFRAGVPQIIVPHNADQPYWGRMVNQLGVGTRPIPRGKLTAERLAAAISEATSSQTMREQATALSRKIEAEDGVGATLQALDAYLR